MPHIKPAFLFAFVPILLAAVSLAGCSTEHSGKLTKHRWTVDSYTRSVEIRGEVDFTDDDRDVASLTPGGYILIEEGGVFGADRSYRVEAASDGSLTRTYQAGGRVQPLDRDAEAWASNVLLAMVRETGIHAGARTERLLRKGGPASVLNEAGKIHSDSTKRTYLRELIERGRLDVGSRRDVMRSARSIGSDGERAALLFEVSKDYLRSEARDAWFATMSGIGSDGEKRRLAENAIEAGMDAESLTLLAQVAGGFGSDGDKAAVLGALAKEQLSGPAQREWFRSVRTIGSDGEKARVLKRAADFALEAPETGRAYLKVVNTLGSDGERRAVLHSFLNRSAMSAEVVIAAIESAAEMGSDGEKAAILVFAAERHASDPAVRTALEKAIRSLHSDGETRRVRAALGG